jgi:anti-anti-sigma factor
MGMAIKHDGPIRTVSFDVENLDASLARVLKERLSELLDQGWSVVIDLKGVKFMNSSGLGTICSLFRRAGREKLYLANVCPRLEALLAGLPLDGLPPRHRNVRDALAAMPAT